MGIDKAWPFILGILTTYEKLIKDKFKEEHKQERDEHGDETELQPDDYEELEEELSEARRKRFVFKARELKDIIQKGWFESASNSFPRRVKSDADFLPSLRTS